LLYDRADRKSFVVYKSIKSAETSNREQPSLYFQQF